jgi:hypothetical protein
MFASSMDVEGEKDEEATGEGKEEEEEEEANLNPQEVVDSLLNQAHTSSSLPTGLSSRTKRSNKAVLSREAKEEERKRELEAFAKEKFEAKKTWGLKVREKMVALSILSRDDKKKKKRRRKG